jgi:hypothetical protein
VEGEKTGDGISYASHVKNPNPLKARATTFYDPVHNALDKEAQCAWKEGEGSDWPSVYIQKPFMICSFRGPVHLFELVPSPVFSPSTNKTNSPKRSGTYTRLDITFCRNLYLLVILK